jgi:hypothetical protein
MTRSLVAAAVLAATAAAAVTVDAGWSGTADSHVAYRHHPARWPDDQPRRHTVRVFPTFTMGSAIRLTIGGFVWRWEDPPEQGDTP